jgi:hypothetical protein
MSKGGYARMLHDLLKWKLSKFKIHEFPVTSALEDQRAATLEKDTFKSWLLHAVETGTIATHALLAQLSQLDRQNGDFRGLIGWKPAWLLGVGFETRCSGDQVSFQPRGNA